MEWIVNNWFLLIVAACVICVAIGAIYTFTTLPTVEQMIKVREWLLYAVTMAEKELGAGTGKLKLRLVYEWFVQTFPWISRMISFERFEQMVDYVLEDMHDMIERNTAVSTLVNGERE